MRCLICYFLTYLIIILTEGVSLSKDNSLSNDNMDNDYQGNYKKLFIYYYSIMN